MAFSWHKHKYVALQLAAFALGCRSNTPNDSRSGTSVASAPLPRPLASISKSASGAVPVAAVSEPPRAFVDAPPVALKSKTFRRKEPSCTVKGQTFQVTSGIEPKALARVNALLSPPESSLSSVPRPSWRKTRRFVCHSSYRPTQATRSTNSTFFSVARAYPPRSPPCQRLVCPLTLLSTPAACVVTAPWDRS